MYLTVLEAFQTILELVVSCLQVSEIGKIFLRAVIIFQRATESSPRHIKAYPKLLIVLNFFQIQPFQ